MARPRKFDEAVVMGAVRDRFWDSGYAGTTVDDLCDATGLGKGSLYGAFGDKHALFVRTLTEYCKAAVEQARQILRGHGDAYDRLTAYVTHVARTSDRRGCLMARSAAELAAVDEEVADCVRQTLADMHAGLSECIGEAQREGVIATDAEPDKLASLLLAVVRGLEALGKGGVAPSMVTDAAEQALALLPRATPAEQ